MCVSVCVCSSCGDGAKGEMCVCECVQSLTPKARTIFSVLPIKRGAH